jgi:hypothetical protein
MSERVLADTAIVPLNHRHQRALAASNVWALTTNITIKIMASDTGDVDSGPAPVAARMSPVVRHR